MTIAPQDAAVYATARAWVEARIDDRLRRPWGPGDRVRNVALPELAAAQASAIADAYRAVGWTVAVRAAGDTATLIFARPT